MITHLLTRIDLSMHSLSKGQKRIALYIEEHYDKAAFMTASKLGETVGVSESTVVERGNTVRFVMYEKAAVNPAKIPELLSKYDHALKFIPDQKGPYFVLNRGTNSRTVSGSSINYIRQFVLDVQTILVEKTIKKDA